MAGSTIYARRNASVQADANNTDNNDMATAPGAGTQANTGQVQPGAVSTSTPAGNAAGTVAPAGNATPAGNAAGTVAPVQPLNVDYSKPGTDLSGNGLNVGVTQPVKPIVQAPSVGAVQDANEAQLEYAKAHPWVVGNDYNEKYGQAGNLTGVQIAKDINTYRQMTGDKQLSLDEIYAIMDGHNPFKSNNQEKKEKRREAWRERLDAIGDVLAHFVNFGRAMGGNPIAQVQNNYNSERYDRLRQADKAFQSQAFTNYIKQLAQQQARQEKDADRQAEFDYKVKLMDYERNTPEYKLKMKQLFESVDPNSWDNIIKKYNAELSKKKLEDYDEQKALDDAYLEARTEALRIANKNGGKKSSGGSGSKTKQEKEEEYIRSHPYIVGNTRFDDLKEAKIYARQNGLTVRTNDSSK